MLAPVCAGDFAQSNPVSTIPPKAQAYLHYTTHLASKIFTVLRIFTAQQKTVLISALTAAITNTAKNSFQTWSKFHSQAIQYRKRRTRFFLQPIFQKWRTYIAKCHQPAAKYAKNANLIVTILKMWHKISSASKRKNSISNCSHISQDTSGVNNMLSVETTKLFDCTENSTMSPVQTVSVPIKVSPVNPRVKRA